MLNTSQHSQQWSELLRSSSWFWARLHLRIVPHCRLPWERTRLVPSSTRTIPSIPNETHLMVTEMWTTEDPLETPSSVVIWKWQALAPTCSHFEVRWASRIVKNSLWCAWLRRARTRERVDCLWNKRYVVWQDYVWFCLIMYHIHIWVCVYIYIYICICV